jgi:cytochrome c-type biogenesis protein CcmH/NrfG/O-antigen ligase
VAARRAARRQFAAAKADPGLAFHESKLRVFGVALVCAYVALVPLAFDYAADLPFVVPKALLSHSIAYVLVGVMAGLIIRFGREALVWSWLHVPILAFLVANVAATIFAEDRLLALYGTHGRMLGLGTIAAWTALYFGVVTLIRTRRDVVALVAAGLMSAVVMLGYECVQLLGRDPFVWNSDTAVRPFSTNGQATSLAAYFTVLAVSAFAVALAVRDMPRWRRLALLLFSAALLAGAAATGTRAALIGLAIGSTVLVALIWLKHPSRRARLIAAAASAAVTLGFAALLTLTPIGGRILQVSPVAGDSEEGILARFDLASVDVRAVLYQVALDVVRERPLLGGGPDNFVVGMTRHRPEHGPDEARLSFATSAHSWVAQIVTGSGLIGLASFIAIVAGVAVLTARSGFYAIPVAAAAGVATHLGTGLTSVTDVGSDWLFWVACALMVGFTARASHEVSTSSVVAESIRRRARPVLRAAPGGLVLALLCTAAGISLALTSLRAMDASRSARLSQNSRLAGAVGPALDAGLAATTADPGRAEYWQRLGLAYVSVSRWPDAADALDRAVRLAPWDVRYVQDLVQTQLILASGGDNAARARAERLVDEAVRRDPNYPAAHYTRAVVMQLNGRVQEGLRSIERAMVLSPNTTDRLYYVIATQLYVAAGRAEDGVRVARVGLSVTDSPQIRIELARALLASGRAQEALPQVDYILAAEPGNTEAQRLRSEILAAIPR